MSRTIEQLIKQLAAKKVAQHDVSRIQALSVNGFAFHNMHVRLSERWEDMANIEDNAVDGKVWLRAWSRDCDHCTSTRAFQIDANWNAWNRALDMMSDDAEGPWNLTIISPERAAEFQPEFRDHILEAHEDGHPYSVAV